MTLSKKQSIPLVYEARRFSQQLCSVLKISMYVRLIIFDEYVGALSFWDGWSGKRGQDATASLTTAHMIAELLIEPVDTAHGSWLRKSPWGKRTPFDANHPLSAKQKGGVVMYDPVTKAIYGVSVTGSSDEGNLLHAMLLLTHMITQGNLQLHHVTFEYESPDALFKAVTGYINHLEEMPMYSAAQNDFIFKIDNPDTKWGHYWIELKLETITQNRVSVGLWSAGRILGLTEFIRAEMGYVTMGSSPGYDRQPPYADIRILDPENQAPTIVHYCEVWPEPEDGDWILR